MPASDQARGVVPASRGSDDDAPDLIAHVRDHSHAVITSELRRLAGKAPSLRPEQLTVIGKALDELADSLLLSPLRGMSEHGNQLRGLFDAVPRKDP